MRNNDELRTERVVFSIIQLVMSLGAIGLILMYLSIVG